MIYQSTCLGRIRLLVLLTVLYALYSGCTADSPANDGNAIAIPMDATLQGNLNTDADPMEDAETNLDATSTADADDVGPPRPPAYLGGDRPATYALPYGYEPDQLMPLVISMHGFGGNANWHDAYWGLSAITKELGVFLIMPDGRKNLDDAQFWSATDACCNFHSAPDADSNYLRGLIEEAQLYFNIDPQRIILVGHSNGGFMSYRAACDHSDLITHVSALAGTTWFEWDRCNAAEPVSVYHLHGTWDTVIRYSGQGLTLTAPLNAGQCQREACGDEYDTCMGTAECTTLNECLNECGPSPRQQDCRDICMLQANQFAREDWTELFMCTLNAGCYDSRPGYFGPYPGAESTVRQWSEHNRCSGADILESTDLDRTLVGSETKLAEFNQCDRDTNVRLGRIERGSHSPGLTPNFSLSILEWFLDTPRR
jgi:poly(3-hydroxybutyrate) depolymerase